MSQPDTRQLTYVYEGWEGYNQSLVNAVRPLTAEQLAFSAATDMRCVAELAWHIADGRVDWFQRINLAGCQELIRAMEERRAVEAFPKDGEKIAAWLERTWQMVDQTLRQWTVDDLPVTYEQPYQGKVYAVSRQWVIFRIFCHDIHHGGQLSEILAAEGIFPGELTWLGGHLTAPPVLREAE